MSNLNFMKQITTNKTGPARVDAISKARKQQKDFKVSKYSLLQHPKTFFEKSLSMPKKLKGATVL